MQKWIKKNFSFKKNKQKFKHHLPPMMMMMIHQLERKSCMLIQKKLCAVVAKYFFFHSTVGSLPLSFFQEKNRYNLSTKKNVEKFFFQRWIFTMIDYGLNEFQSFSMDLFIVLLYMLCGDLIFLLCWSNRLLS